MLAMYLRSLQLAGFLHTQNRSSFLCVERSTDWLYDRSRHLSHLSIAE